MSFRIKNRDQESRTLTSNFANENIDVYSCQQYIGHIYDTSTKGFMFFSKYLYDKDTNLQLEIEVPNRIKKIKIQGNVRWTDPELNTIGIKILPEDIALWKKVQGNLPSL